MADSASGADRRLAAVAHLGVPLWSILLPLMIWANAGGSHFRRVHAGQAFSFRCVFLAVWIVLVGLMAAGVVETTVLLVVLACGVIIELPQVLRALQGRLPFRLVPLDLLRP